LYTCQESYNTHYNCSKIEKLITQDKQVTGMHMHSQQFATLLCTKYVVRFLNRFLWLKGTCESETAPHIQKYDGKLCGKVLIRCEYLMDGMDAGIPASPADIIMLYWLATFTFLLPLDSINSLCSADHLVEQKSIFQMERRKTHVTEPATKINECSGIEKCVKAKLRAGANWEKELT